MPGWGWANLFVPLFHCYKAPAGLWFQSGQDLLPSYYLGVGVLALAAAGVCMGRGRFRFVLFGTVLAFWVLALGSNGYFYDWLRKIFPFIGVARFPVKFAVFPAFLLPLLAAQGINFIQAGENPRTRSWLGVIVCAILALIGGLLLFARAYPFPHDQWPATAWNALWRAVLMVCLLAGIMFMGKIRTRTAALGFQVALLAILPLDAMTHSPGIVPTLPASVLAPGAWQAANHTPAPGLGQARVMISPAAEQRLLYSALPDPALDLTAKRLAQWYNSNLLDGVPKVNGAIPLHSKYFEDFEYAIYYKPGGRFGPGLLDFLSVALYTSPDNAVEWSVRTNYLPVLTAGQKPLFASNREALEGVVAGDFNPRDLVYLPTDAQPLITCTNKSPCAVSNALFTPQRVEADTDSAAPALVVLSSTFHHLWRATVDRRPVPLFRANLAFQALQVPAGKHHIALEYHDPNLVIGACASLASLAVCGWIWFRRSRES
jgi:hypothetical protein